MPRSPHRRLSALLGLLVVFAGTVLAVTLPAAPARAAATDDRLPVEVRVTKLAPRAPTAPDEPFQIVGRLRNTGAERVEDLEVRVRTGGVLRSRSALARADESLVRTTPRGDAVEPSVAALAPDGSVSFDLRLTVEDLRLRSLGVYPVQVEVRGRVDGGRLRTLGVVQTFVPWFPDGPPSPTRIAFLWPLIDEPARAPNGTFLGDDLAAALRPDHDDPVPFDDEEGGRLAALLAAAVAGSQGGCAPRAEPAPNPDATAAAPAPAPPPGPAAPAPPGPPPPAPCRGEPVPITFAVDPALLEGVAALATEHRVRTDEGDVIEPGLAPAREWLETLRAAVTDPAAAPPAEVLSVPYGDPDVVAITLADVGLTDDIPQLRALGNEVVEELLGVAPRDDVAWPPGGEVTAAALATVVAGGADGVVLDEQAFPVNRSSARTPGARTELSASPAGRIAALVIDEALSELLAAAPDDPDWAGPRLAEQRWLAETAIIAAERPGESRTLLVAPPRRADVHPQVATEVLRDAGRLPWLCAVPVGALVEGNERCPAEPVSADERQPEVRGDLLAPDDDELLSPRFLREVAAIRARGQQLTDDVLVPGTDAAAEIASNLLRVLGRTVSAAWREQPVEGRAMLGLYEAEVDWLRSQVQLTTSGEALLTSSSGVLDVLISNSLDAPVAVGVALNDPIEARLTSTDTDIRTVGAHQAVPVQVSVETRTSGQFVVRAVLLDRTGDPFGEPVELVVRSTRYGRVALAVTGVAAGVLLVAVGVRIARRALRGHREAA